jgi:putative ABC transport system permease protein
MKNEGLVKQYRMALHSLRQHRLRSLLSMLGVIFGIIAIVTMLSVGEGVKRKTLAQIEQLGTKNIILRTLDLTEAQALYSRERLSLGLSEEDLAGIRANIPWVDRMAPVRQVRASVLGIPEELYPDVLAVTSDYLTVSRLTLNQGRFLSDLDSAERHFVCVLGSDIAKNLGSVGQVGGVIRIETEMFRVVGVLEPRLKNAGSALSLRDINRAIFIPMDTERYLVRPRDIGGYSEIMVHAVDVRRIFSLAGSIRSLIDRNHKGAADYQMIIPQELLNKQREAQSNFNFFLGAIAVISLIVGGIGIMNIMLANVSERTSEIGVRRAIGASRDHIRWQFMTEAILISMAGGVIGLGLGILSVMLIALFGSWSPVVSPWILLLSLIMAFVVGLASGLYPALKASKMDPIQALRQD